MSLGFSAQISCILVMTIAACGSPAEPVPPPPAVPHGPTVWGVNVVSGDHQVAPAGTPFAGRLIVVARDSAGHPVARRAVTWTVTGSAKLVSKSDTTADDGTAYATISADTNSGTATIGAKVDAVSAGMFAFSFAPPLIFTVVDAIAPVTTCAGVRKGVMIRIRDALGQLIPAGSSVQWSSTLAGDVLGVGTMGASGIATDTVALGSSNGAREIHASIGGFTSPPFPFTSVSPCPIVSLALTTASGALASTGSQLALSATVHNDSGLVVPGVSVTWDAPGHPGAVTPAVSLTDANGVAHATFATGALPGTIVVRAVSSGFTQTAPIAIALAPPAPVATISLPAGALSLNAVRVRDGLAFLSAATAGTLIYDVGNGMAGGSPAQPRLVSQLATPDLAAPTTSAAFTSRLFANPVTGERRYLFVGQRGPGILGSTTAIGDIHVIDVSSLSSPVDVGFIHVDGGSVQDLLLDEPNQVLFAALGAAGVARIDVSGVLGGNLSNRLLQRVRPGGSAPSAAVGLSIANGVLYVSDMWNGLLPYDLASLEQVDRGPGSGALQQGGWMTDVWFPDGVGYTGTGNSCGGGVRVFDLRPQVTAVAGFSLPNAECTISALSGTPDRQFLAVAAEQGDASGFWLYRRNNPFLPNLHAWYAVPAGVRDVEISVIGGRTYLFAATAPPLPQLLIFDITDIVQ